MPEAAKGKATHEAPSRKIQDRPQARGQTESTGPYGDIARLQNRVGNRATAGLLGEQGAPAPRIGLSGGQPLDPVLRTVMESRFRHDFGQVRLHTGDGAAALARSKRARAYTQGHEIVFGADQYAPHEESGRGLLAHELTHVVQQSRPAPSEPNSAHEQEAGSAERLANGGAPIPVSLGSVPGAIQCSPDPPAKRKIYVDSQTMNFISSGKHAEAEKLIKELQKQGHEIYIAQQTHTEMFYVSPKYADPLTPEDRAKSAMIEAELDLRRAKLKELGISIGPKGGMGDRVDVILKNEDVDDYPKELHDKANKGNKDKSNPKKPPVLLSEPHLVPDDDPVKEKALQGNKNDVLVAAQVKAAGGELLTLDGDFLKKENKKNIGPKEGLKEVLGLQVAPESWKLSHIPDPPPAAGGGGSAPPGHSGPSAPPAPPAPPPAHPPGSATTAPPAPPVTHVAPPAAPAVTHPPASAPPAAPVAPHVASPAAPAPPATHTAAGAPVVAPAAAPVPPFPHVAPSSPPAPPISHAAAPVPPVPHVAPPSPPPAPAAAPAPPVPASGAPVAAAPRKPVPPPPSTPSVSTVPHSDAMFKDLGDELRKDTRDFKQQDPLKLKPVDLKGHSGAPTPLDIGKHGIEMPWVGEGKSSSEKGYLRDSEAYWKAYKNKWGDHLSPENKKRIDEGHLPEVDDTWIKFHPAHAGYKNLPSKDKVLEHHHVGQGSLAVPLPAKLHDAYTVFHPQRQVVGEPGEKLRPLKPLPTAKRQADEVKRHIKEDRIKGPGIVKGQTPAIHSKVPLGSELASVPEDELDPIHPGTGKKIPRPGAPSPPPAPAGHADADAAKAGAAGTHADAGHAGAGHPAAPDHPAAPPPAAPVTDPKHIAATVPQAPHAVTPPPPAPSHPPAAPVGKPTAPPAPPATHAQPADQGHAPPPAPPKPAGATKKLVELNPASHAGNTPVTPKPVLGTNAPPDHKSTKPASPSGPPAAGADTGKSKTAATPARTSGAPPAAPAKPAATKPGPAPPPAHTSAPPDAPAKGQNAPDQRERSVSSSRSLGVIAGPNQSGVRASAGVQASQTSKKGIKTTQSFNFGGQIKAVLSEVGLSSPPRFIVTVTIDLSADVGGSVSREPEGKAGVGLSGSASLSLVLTTSTPELPEDEARKFLGAVKTGAGGPTPALRLAQMVKAGNIEQAKAFMSQIKRAGKSAAAAKDMPEGASDTIVTGAAADAGINASKGRFSLGVSVSKSGQLRITRTRKGDKVYLTIEVTTQTGKAGNIGASVGVANIGVSGSDTQSESQSATFALDTNSKDFETQWNSLISLDTVQDLRRVADLRKDLTASKTKGHGSSSETGINAGVAGVGIGFTKTSSFSSEVTEDEEGITHRVEGSGGGGAALTIGDKKALSYSKTDTFRGSVGPDKKGTGETRTTTNETDVGKSVSDLGASLKKDTIGTIKGVVTGGYKVVQEKTDSSGKYLEDDSFERIAQLAQDDKGWEKSWQGSTDNLLAWRALKWKIKRAEGDRVQIQALLAKFEHEGTDRNLTINKAVGGAGSNYEFPDSIAPLEPVYLELVRGNPAAHARELASAGRIAEAKAEFDAIGVKLDKLMEGVTNAKDYKTPDASTDMINAIGKRRAQLRTEARKLAPPAPKADVPPPNRIGPPSPDESAAMEQAKADEAAKRQDLDAQINVKIQACKTNRAREQADFATINQQYSKDEHWYSSSDIYAINAQLSDLQQCYAKWDAVLGELRELLKQRGDGPDAAAQWAPNKSQYWAFHKKANSKYGYSGDAPIGG